jgi:hypothetical protein
MATNPRVPGYEEPREPRKQPQLVWNSRHRKPKRRAGGAFGLILGIGVALVLLVALIYFLPRMLKHKPPATAAEMAAQPVPGELQLHGMQLIAAADDESYYLDGSVTNMGPHAITGLVADVKLRDVEKNVVLDVQQPLQGMLMKDHNLISDPLAQNPIMPNDTRRVRLALNNLPRDWDHNLPQIQIVTVMAQGH